MDPGSSAFYGGAVTSAAGLAAFSYTIPNDPGLSGLRLLLQGVGTTSLAGGMRLSTCQAMWVR